MLYLNFFNSRKYSLDINGFTRDYLLHAPSSSEKMPLVIALHGYKDYPRLMEFYSGLSRKADKEKFIVAYPYGTNNQEDKNLSWNGGVCCGNGVLSNVSDVEFINNLTDELIRTQNVDPKRVYVVGFSNGALLAYRIAAETPDKYKAFAIVSGSIGGKVYKKLPPYVIPDPKKPISVLIMHGMNDKRIPYLGGENANKDGSFKSFKDSGDLWIRSNVCGDGVKAENKLIIHESFSKCKDEVNIDLYTVKDSGHVWFGSLMEFPKNFMGKAVPATDIIWNFFNK